MRKAVKKGATSQMVELKLTDSTNGQPKSGLLYSDMTITYTRKGASAATSVSPVTATLGTYTNGGFKEFASTGKYQFGIPDTAIATGSDSADEVSFLFSASGIIAKALDISLEAVDRQDATGMGLSRMDAAVTSRMATYTQPAGFLAATFPGTVASTTNITAGTITTVTTATNLTTNNDKTGYALTAGYDPAKTAAQAGDSMALTSGERATLAAAIWNALTSGMSTAGSIGKRLIDYLTGDIFTRLGAPAGASTAADIAAVKADSAAIKLKTDNLPASPAAVGSAMTLPNGAIIPATFASNCSTSTLIGANAILLNGTESGQALADSVLAIPSGESSSIFTGVAAAAVAAAQGAVNTNTLLSRIGAITGSGVNTVLGFFKAMLSKTATTPSDVGGTFNPATDSTEAIRDRGDAAWTTGSGGSGSVTITPVTSTVDAGEVVSEPITAYQGATKTFDIVIVDADGDPIDLSAKVIRFTAGKHSTPDDAIIEHDNAALDGVTITGADSNVVSVTLDATDTATPETLDYTVWDITDDPEREVLAKDLLTIVATVQ